MKKTIILVLSFLLVISLALTACGSKASNDTTASGMAYSESPMALAEEADKQFDSGVVTNQSESYFASVDSAIYSDPNAKVIRTAEMTIQTIDFEKSVADLAALTEAQGGYYETAQVDGGSFYDSYVRRSAYYVVRIPKENFVAFRNAVNQVGHLYSITEDSRNVGEEYYDAEARLATLEIKHERLLALLDKAELMEDIIKLENALADVQYEIDMYNTTLRKYDSLIDYSTFTVHLNEVIKIEQDPGPQEGFGTRLLANLKDGFTDFAEAMQDFAFWLARNIITLVILAVIVVVVIKVVLWRRKKRRARYDGE